MADEGRKHGAGSLRVYALAKSLVADIKALLPGVRIDPARASQLLRSADSIVLNLGEGGAHHMPGLKLNNYRAAHASAGETISVLELVARDNPKVNAVRLAIRKGHMTAVMILGLIKTQEARRK
jgi:four helix bundle protein